LNMCWQRGDSGPCCSSCTRAVSTDHSWLPGLGSDRCTRVPRVSWSCPEAAANQSPGRWIVPEICNRATVAVITMMKARITATLLSSGMGRAPSEVARTFVLRIGSAGEGTVGSGEFCCGSEAESRHSCARVSTACGDRVRHGFATHDLPGFALQNLGNRPLEQLAIRG
jgi:hypothetical protein